MYTLGTKRQFYIIEQGIFTYPRIGQAHMNSETSTRLLTTLVQNSTKKEDDTNATQLRIFREILGDPNCSEESKVRAQSLMESLLQSQMDELQR